MKKTLSFLMIVCMLASLFISCDAAIADDQHVSVSFATTSSRSLTTDTTIDSLDNYVWWYKANTADDNANFQYGSTGDTWTKVGGDGNLSGVVVISRGIWNFDLCGVRRATEESGAHTPSENPTMIVYSGSAYGKLVDKNVNKIDIEVSASPTGTGKISISKNIIINKRTISGTEATQVVANMYSMINPDGTSVSITDIPNDPIVVPAGDYKVTVYYKETNGNTTYEIASEEVSITVYGDSTVTISGTLDEETQGIRFNAISQFEVSTEMPVSAGSEVATLKSTVTPAMSSNAQEKTVVEVPASVLGVNATTSKDVQLLVKVTPVTETASAGFSIEPVDGSSLVAGINLSLATKNEEGQYVDVDYAGNTAPITVTTYVAKNLVNPSVRYVGTGSTQPSFVSYEPSTGKLIFTTTHFSTFVVESESEALIGDTAYLTLSEAISSAKSRDTITLLKDITLLSHLDITNGKSLNLDLNGHNINCGNNSIRILSYDDYLGGELNIVGAGSIIGSRDFEDNQWLAWTFQLRGENDRSSSEKCNLSIGKDVIVDSPYAISILSKKNTSTSFGVNVDIYGTVKGPEPIYVNGTIGTSETDFTNYPVINIHDGAEIICENGETVYLAGYAKTTIGNAILTSDANCITIAAGELTVNGASITGGTSFGFNPGGGGSITFDEASAIYVKQHTTNLPLIVSVNSGTLSGAVPFYQAKGQNGDTAKSEDVRLSISGGEFICTANYGEDTAVKSDDKSGFITGGVFSADPSKYVADGYCALQEDGRYFIREGILVSNKNEFVTAVQGNYNTIYLGKDFTVGSTVTINRDVTVDGRGNTLTAYYANPVIKIEGNVDVTLKDLSINPYTQVDGIQAIGSVKKLTFEGVTVTYGFKAIHFIGGNDTEVLIKDCNLTSVYPFNVNGSNVASFIVESSSLNGWTSFSNSTKTTYYFNNSTFGEGCGYATVKPYGNTIFTGCKFSADYFDSLEGGIATGTNTPITIKFNNCFMITSEGQEALTVDLLKTAFNYDITSGSSSGDSTINDQYWFVNGEQITLNTTEE